MKLLVSVVFLFLGSAVSVQDVSSLKIAHMLDLDLDSYAHEAMRASFVRSEEAHQASMAEMMKTMMLDKAFEVLQQNHVGHEEELLKVASLVKKGKRGLRQQPTGYSAVDGARDMLNDMIYKAYVKYDEEIMECTEFYYQHCAEMEACRGEISAANYIAANSREMILDSQGTINRCEVTIPALKLELKQHKLRCEHELTEMNKRLAIVLGDIEVMTNILEMTDCDAQSATSTQSQAQAGFLQNGGVTFRKCTDQCTHKTFLEFNHKGLQEKMQKLKSQTSHNLMQQALSGLVEGVKGLEMSYELLQDQEGSNHTSSATYEMLQAHEHQNTSLLQAPTVEVDCKCIPCGTKDPKDYGSGNCAKSTSTCNANSPASPGCYSSVDGGCDCKTLKAKIPQKAVSEPPAPRTEKAADPCDEPPVPSMKTKRAAKCVLSGANCYKLQERFLLIQSGIQDERDELQDKIAEMEQYCEETEANINTQISNDEEMLEAAQTKLAEATEKEATAQENARKANEKHETLDSELRKKMKTCNDNYIGFEGELCALKKIRGELYKLQGGGHSSFFQDCEVSKWDPEECTKKCGGGQQKLSRSVMTHEQDGAKCVPLSAERSCNNQPCPVNCKLSAWSGWSKCSADCGGGVEQRLKEVEVAMKHNGKPCGETSQTRACNAQACEKDCELSEWSSWSACSKDCDGGTKKRSKYVAHEPEGAGKCADEWDVTRLEYKKCNEANCGTPEIGDCNTHEHDDTMYSCTTLPQCCAGFSGMGTEAQQIQCLPDSWVSDPKYMVTCAGKMYTKKCSEPLDVVLLIDGSGSLGQKGWDASIVMASRFVDAFADSGPPGESQANMAVILFSGPPTWSGVNKCIGKAEINVNMETDCRIKTVTHFTRDMGDVKTKIEALTWPQGSTLTSLALMTAKSELSLGRKDSKAVIVVITDGRPLSYRKTWQASRVVRKTARLVWMPVTQYAPLGFIKRCATRRWQENVVQVDSFEELLSPTVVTELIADICPDADVFGYSHWR